MTVEIPEVLYAVFTVHKTLKINGVSQELPDGFWYVPVFENREDAVKFSNGVGDIVELEKPKTKIIKMK